MKKKRYIYIIAFIGLLLSACITEFTPEVSTAYSNLLVVEGEILSDDASTFYIGWTSELSVGKDNPTYEAYAHVTIIGDDGYESASAEYQGNGVYKLHTGSLDENVGYAVKIWANDHEYQSDFRKPMTTPAIDSLGFEQKEKAGEVDFRISTNCGDAIEPSYLRWTYEEVWETKAAYYTPFAYDPVEKAFYQFTPNHFCWQYENQHSILIESTATYVDNTLVNHKLFSKEASEGGRFYRLYRLRVTQKRIPQDSYKYQQNKVLLNEEMGGLFTPQPSEIKSNLECITDPSRKVIGFVDVLMNTSTATVYVSSADVSSRGDVSCLQIVQGDNLSQLYNAGLRPIGGLDVSLSGNITYNVEGWVLERCMDCVAAGGRLDKPEDWPR